MAKSRVAVIYVAGIFLVSLLAAQAPRGPEIAVNQRHRGQQWLPQVAVAPDGDFVVTWGSRADPPFFESAQAWFRVFAADGTPKTPDRRVSDRTGEKEGFPAVAVGPDGGFVIVWHSGGDRDSAVYGRRFTAAGQPLGNAFQLSAASAGSQYDPAVDVADDGSFVAVWRQGPQPRGEVADVFARRFDAAGRPLGPDIQVDPGAAGAKAIEPRVGVDASGGFVVSWIDAGDSFLERSLLVRRFAADGTPLGPTLQVNADVVASVSPLYALDVAASGEAVLVWTSFDADVRSVGVVGRLVDADGSLGAIFEVSSFSLFSQERPAVTFGPDGGFYVAWRVNTGLAGRPFAADATPRGARQIIDSIPRRRGVVSLDYPAVALNASGRGVVAWTHFQPDAEVVARRLEQAP